MLRERTADTIYWDDIGREWAAGTDDALWRRYCDERHAALVGRWLPAAAGARMLKTDAFDEAVSAGVYPSLRTFGRVHAVDVSPVILDAARRRHPRLVAAAGDVRQLPYHDAAFDAVISLSTLDHGDSVDHIAQGLAELHRVLRPGGSLIVTIDNALHPAVALRARLPFGLLRAAGVLPYRVGVTCTARGFERLLIAQGFDVRALTYVEHCPRLLAVRIGRGLQRASRPIQRGFLRALEGFERLERWPFPALTGHYIAAWASRR